MKTNLICFGIVALLLSGCTASHVGSSPEIDPSQAVIVSPSAATARGAAELQTNLFAVCGVTLSVVKKAPEGRFAFVLDERRRPDEGWAWEASPTNVLFTGATKWAVLDFLERALDVRWPVGDLIVAPTQKRLVLRTCSAEGAINLRIHNIRCVTRRGTTEENRAFHRRMRFGSHDAPLYGHAFTKYWNRFGKDHPEYFAQRADGVRAPRKVKDAAALQDVAVYAADGHQVAMCVSCEGLVDQIIADWKADGAKRYLNICENDVYGPESCQCAACRALDAPLTPEQEKSGRPRDFYTDRYVNFGNRVLAKARQIRPDAEVCYYAYNASRDAPARERPAEGSIIAVVPTEFTHASIESYLGGWAKMGARAFLYRPNRHHYFVVPFLPLGSERHFHDLFREIRAKGAVGFDYDAPAKLGFFQWHQDYVLARAMAYEEESYEDIERHYFAAFGPARAEAEAYFRYWREEVWDKRLEPDMDKLTTLGKWHNFGRGLLQHLKDYYRESDFAATDPLVESMRTKAAGSASAALVEELATAHAHAKLFFRAVAFKSKANTERLIAFRRAHAIPLYFWYEQYYGDLTGIEGLLGKEKKPSL